MANRQAKHWPMPISSIQCLLFTHQGSSTVFNLAPQKLQGSPCILKSQRYTQSYKPKCDLLSVPSHYTLNPMLLPMPIIPGHLNSSGSRHALGKHRWNSCSILFAWAWNKIMDVKHCLTYKRLHTQVIIIASLTYATGCKQIQLEKGKSMKKSNGEGRGASNLGQLGTAKLVQESSASSQPGVARRASHSIFHSGWCHGE